MLVGTVVGTVVSTLKDESLIGMRMLMIKEDKSSVITVAVDGTQSAGIGCKVFYITGKEACFLFPDNIAPIDAGIVGIID